MSKNIKKFDEKKLADLLAKGKYGDAKEIIQEVLASDLTSEERGAALTNMAQLYLELNNKMSARYVAVLDEAIATLKAMDATAKKAEEDMALSAAKKKLDKIY
ncbi:MAG: hypothetical protein NTX82_00260 [Candidatus Parcubacteria bacterium]|nr:hypothetical protein [Candidatus Parcubacteria bacterium]